MLSKLRGFSNTKLAGVLIGIIIIPFVFWGMGSVFSGGNTNNVAKINREPISTQNFVDHVNRSRLNIDVIKKNIDNNIIEEILSELISNKLIEMEINYLKLSLNENELAKKIKSNEVFMDDKKLFSRLKYEKFLLENNLTAYDFENRFKKQELKKDLFNYISGGIKSPFFLQNKIFENETKKIELDYFDLKYSYINETTNKEIDDFINDNKEMLKDDYLTLSYTKITPNDLIEIEEFNNEFFKKIDEIENSILNGFNLKEIGNKYNLSIKNINKYKVKDNSDDILKEIYSKRNEDKIQLIDKNEYFLLFEIINIEKILPNKTDSNFIDKVKSTLLLKKKYELHQELFEKIQNKKINDSEFIKIAKNKNNVKKITINGIADFNKFDSDSIKLLYSLPNKNFTLITDNENKIYLAKINNIYYSKLNSDDEMIKDYETKSNGSIINDIFGTYDLSLNNKYKVKIYQSTLDRVKNYFR